MPDIYFDSMPFTFEDSNPVPPLFGLSHTDPPTENTIQFLLPSTWYSGTETPVIYDVTYGTPSDVTIHHRYEVIVDEDLLGARLVEFGKLPMGDVDDCADLKDPLRFCNDCIMTSWWGSESYALRVYTSHLRPGSQQQTPHVSGLSRHIQTAIYAVDPCSTTFCPVSGRLAFNDGNPDTERQIVVLDFLSVGTKLP